MQVTLPIYTRMYCNTVSLKLVHTITMPYVVGTLHYRIATKHNIYIYTKSYIYIQTLLKYCLRVSLFLLRSLLPRGSSRASTRITESLYFF